MTSTRHIKQSRFGLANELDLGAEELRYAFRDHTGERIFTFPYESLQLKNVSRLTVNNRAMAWRLRLVPIIAFLAGSVIAKPYPGISWIILISSTIIFVALLIAGNLNVFAVKFIIIPLSPPPIGAQGHPLRIIEDGRHADIIAELSTRWSERLKSRYGTADLTGDLQAELARMTWLSERGVLNAEEFRTQVDLIRQVEASRGPSSNLLN